MAAEQYTLPPRHPLFPFVKRIWQVHVTAPYWRQRVLPGGVVDLLFPLEGALTIINTQAGEAVRLASAAFLAGPQSRAVVSETYGSLLLLGVSLRMEASRAVLPCAAHELGNLTIAAPDVLVNSRDLFGRLYEAPTFGSRCALLLQWIEPLVKRSTRLTRFTNACDALKGATDDSAVGRAAAMLGCSPRHLRRTFLEYVGTSPSEYVRWRRFRRSLRLMQPSHTLTDIAQFAGYYDQAHFCRDFKDFAGVTPGEYRRRVGPVPDILFSTDVRLIQAPDAPSS